MANLREPLHLPESWLVLRHDHRLGTHSWKTAPASNVTAKLEIEEWSIYCSERDLRHSSAATADVELLDTDDVARQIASCRPIFKTLVTKSYRQACPICRDTQPDFRSNKLDGRFRDGCMNATEKLVKPNYILYYIYIYIYFYLNFLISCSVFVFYFSFMCFYLFLK